MQAFPQTSAPYIGECLSSAELSAVLDAFPGHVALLDHDARIVAVNRNWRDFADSNGYRGDDYGVGSPYMSDSHADDSSGTRYMRDAVTLISGVLDGSRESGSFLYPCHAPDRKRWFRMFVSPFDHGARPHALVMHFDATAECEARIAELRELRQLRQTGGAGRLGEMVHDIKNPLNVVSALAQMMEMGIFAPGPEKQREFGRSIAQACEQLMGIVSELVETLEDDPTKTVEELDVGAFLRFMAEQYAPAAARAQMTIRTAIEDGVAPLYVRRRDMERMIANLIVNAINYAGAGATITLRARLAGRQVNVEVEDDGIGVPPDRLADIQRRGERGASGGVAGNGIGLSSVRSLASRYGASVFVAAGTGSGFRVRLTF